MSDAGFVAVMFALIVLGSIAVLWMAMQNRQLQRELQHRERLAMIERGLIPPPEVDPAAFETRAGLAGQPEGRGAARSRSAGIIMIGFGLGLTMLISLAAGEPEIGIGIGGAFADARRRIHLQLGSAEPPRGLPPPAASAVAITGPACISTG